MSDELDNLSDAALAASPVLLAYRVDIDDMGCIVFAATAAKARWMAVKAYREAGYGRPGVWPRAVAYRRPCYDNSYLKDQDPGRTYTEEFVR